MNPPTTLPSIDAVIETLDQIIDTAVREEDPLGYFAVLYRRVTVKVKEGIEADFFDDNPRMEQLDILFAQRYIDAWHAYRAGRPVTQSWERAFAEGPRFWPIVLQHLLLGINAHINLDLGIAAVAACRDRPLAELENDFNKINAILASLVEEMQGNLAAIWPRLHWILQRTKQIDNHLVDFSMELARDGAWTFAKELAHVPAAERESGIRLRDEKIARKAEIVVGRRWFARVGIALIRLGERGSVAEKISRLRGN